MKKALGAALTLTLALAVVAAVLLGGRGGGDPVGGGDITTVRGLIGSEKKPYFTDPDVVSALEKQGLRVEVETAGSRQIASRDLTGYDFVFPSSAPAADRIRTSAPVKGTYAPFHSPMAIASFEPIAQTLQSKGITRRDGDTWVFDVDAYLTAVDQGLRWDQIEGNDAYRTTKSVLVTTTDIRSSNSAGMFASLASYVLNGNTIVTTPAEAQKAAPTLRKVFLEQGYSESSSEGPFEDYLSMGMGKAPLVLVYESQPLSRQIARDGSMEGGRVVMYPSPGILSKHSLLALDDGGTRLGEALTHDETLQRLAARHGFRPQSPAAFTQTLTDAGLAEPPALTDVIDPPSHEVLERMITDIENQY